MDPTKIDIKAYLEIMPFGKGGGKGNVNQKCFLQTSNLQGKIFHCFFITFTVDKRALRNSLCSRGTSTA